MSANEFIIGGKKRKEKRKMKTNSRRREKKRWFGLRDFPHNRANPQAAICEWRWLSGRIPNSQKCSLDYYYFLLLLLLLLRTQNSSSCSAAFCLPTFSPFSSIPLSFLSSFLCLSSFTMRPQLFRAAARSFRVPMVSYPRTFATTAPRTAEVELTVGMSMSFVNSLCIYWWLLVLSRWQENIGRR